MKFGICDGYNKTNTLNGKNAIKLFMAKNEGESCVISVLSEKCVFSSFARYNSLFKTSRSEKSLFSVVVCFFQ